MAGFDYRPSNTPNRLESQLDAANNHVHGVNDIVAKRLGQMTDLTNNMVSKANSAIGNLANFSLGDTGAAPVPGAFDVHLNLDLDLPQVGPTSFGQVTSQLPPEPTLVEIPQLPDIDIPDFRSSVGAINVPVAPAWTAPDAPPDAPTMREVTIPTTPDIVMPAAPSLTEITVPTFDGLTLPTFDAQAPEFEGTALPGALQWQEPRYESELMPEIIAAVRRMWSGGSGLPPEVEKAMFARAAEREDRAAMQAINSVAEEFSGRGFTMPSGVQAARADKLREELALKKSSLNRDLTIQIAQWQIENMRLAVEKAVAAEQVLVNTFDNMAKRLFEAAKFQVEAQLNVFNAHVSVFNAKMQAYQTLASVYNTRVQAALSKIQVFKAEVDAEIARGQINEQKVKAYSAQINALEAQTSLFVARMKGAETEAAVERSRIEAYRAQVQAYGDQVGAQKVRFDAYEAQVRGETAKAGIVDAEAKAFAALIQGKSANAELGMKQIDALLKKNQNLLSLYQSNLEAEKTRLQAQLGVIQTNASAYTADTQRFSAIAAAEGQKAQAEIAAKEAEIRAAVAYSQAQIQAYSANMEAAIKRAGIISDSLKAAGQISSTLAAGAMAGVHVAASLSGSGSISGSGSVSNSSSFSESHNFNYDKGKV